MSDDTYEIRNISRKLDGGIQAILDRPSEATTEVPTASIINKIDLLCTEYNKAVNVDKPQRDAKKAGEQEWHIIEAMKPRGLFGRVRTREKAVEYERLYSEWSPSFGYIPEISDCLDFARQAEGAELVGATTIQLAKEELGKIEAFRRGIEAIKAHNATEQKTPSR